MRKSAERPSRFRSKEDNSFFGLFRYGNEDALVVDRFAPRLHASEPGIWRRVGGAAQKNDDHQIAHGLAVGQIGMHPQPVARLKVGHFRDRQSHSGSLHPNVNLRADEIKGPTVCAGCAGKGEKAANQKDEQKDDRMRCLAAASRVREDISQGTILTDLPG